MKKKQGNDLASKYFANSGEWIKSGLKSDCYDGGIYFANNSISYIHRIYETLVDSKGNEHKVQVAYEDKEIKLTDDLFEFKKWGRDDDPDWDCILTKRNCPVEFNRLFFQFNLKNYMLFFGARGWLSDLDMFRMITRNFDNEAPDYFWEQHYQNIEAMRSLGYAPFYEYCFNKQINYIPDQIFFNYPNRAEALKRVEAGTDGWDIKKDIFKNFDYVNATDKDLLMFMNDRFRNRLRYEQFKNSHSYIFNK